MDETKGCGGIESVPILSLGHPTQVILQEGVVGGVGVLHGVGPHGGTVEDGALWPNLLLDRVDNLHISVVVFLQELVIESVSYLTLENRKNLLNPLKGFSFFLVLRQLGVQAFHHFALECLHLLVANVESDLVGVEVRLFALNQFLQKRCGSFWLLQVELAFGYFVVVEIA